METQDEYLVTWTPTSTPGDLGHPVCLLLSSVLQLFLLRDLEEDYYFKSNSG